MVAQDRDSAFADPDSHPRDTATLSPWQWLPWTFLLVACVLFFSLRRARAIELYNQAQEFIQDKLSATAAYGRSTVRLSSHDPGHLNPLAQPRPNRLDSMSEEDEDEDVLDDDELPRSATYRSATKRVTDGLSSAGRELAQLVVGNSQGRSRSAFGDTRSDGIARAFWGTGRSRSTGGIRLGSEEFEQVEEGGEVGSGHGGIAASAMRGARGLLASVTDVLSGHGRTSAGSMATARHLNGHSKPARSDRGTRPVDNTAPSPLFQLSDESDDAQELPGAATLREAEFSAARGTGSPDGVRRL